MPQQTPPPPPIIAPALVGSGRFVEGTYSGEHGARRYKLYIPSGLAAGASAASGASLVVMLHGCGQDADDLARGTRMNVLAEAETTLVLYPEQPLSANPRRCWNWFDPAHQRRGAGEPAIVEAITRRVMAEHRVDGRRVYVAGISAGAATALAVAAAYPETYAAVGLHSGIALGAASGIADALVAMQRGSRATDLAAPLRDAMGARAGPMPAIVFQGGADRIVAAVNGEQVARQLAALAAPGSVAESFQGDDVALTRWRDAAGRTAVQLWMVTALGHAWSGGSPDGTFTSAAGPDASREMLRFFREHPRAGPR